MREVKTEPLSGEPGAGPERLDNVPVRTCGTVTAVDAPEGSADQLKAMGVCIGRRVEVVKQGDPLILLVLGSRIGLSARLACGVTIERCAPDHCSYPGPTQTGQGGS